jgi:WD40 repeat protein
VVTVLDVRTGKSVFTLPAGKVANVVFSPNGSTLSCVGVDGLLRILDAKSGKVLHTWKAWRAPRKTVTSRLIAYSPDGKILTSWSGQGSVTLWDPTDGKALRQFPGPNDLSDLTFSPDGKVLGSWDGYAVSLLNAKTGKPHLALPGHTALITSIAPFTGGDLFVSGGGAGRVLVWDRRKPFPLAAYPVIGGYPEAISATGADLFAVEVRANRIEVYRRISPEPVAVFRTNAYFWRTCLSPDEKLLACGDNKATVHLFTLSGKRDVRRLSWAPDGKALLNCLDLAFSIDGTQLAVACSDGTLRIGDVARLRWVRTLGGRAHELGAVAYDPTGLLLAAQGRSKLLFWHASSGELVQRIDVDVYNSGTRSSISFSPDGRYLATCDGRKHATVWEVRSGQVVSNLRGHEAPVIGVCFLAGGRQILTGSYDQTLLLWDRALLHTGDMSRKGLEGTWEDLRGSAENAHGAIWRMVRTPGAVTFLSKRLRLNLRPKDSVRAERIKRWINDLSDKRIGVRDSAQVKLLQNLDDAEGAILQGASKTGLDEANTNLKTLLRRIFDRRRSVDRLRVDRALAVLEYLGTVEARKELEVLAAGASEHWLTQDAKAACLRVKKRTSTER